MNRYGTLLTLAASIGGGSTTASAQTLDYAVYLDGDRIGETVVTAAASTAAPDAVELLTRTSIRVESWGFTVFSLEFEEFLLVGPVGLLEYRSRAEIDGVTPHGHAHRQDGAMQVRLVAADGDTASVVHPLSAFDFTSQEVPDLTGWAAGTTETYRVLDLESGTIREHRYTLIDEEDRQVGDMAIPCWVVRVEHDSGPTRVWLARDGFGTLVREEGRDDDGAYVMQLTGYRAEAGAAGAVR